MTDKTDTKTNGATEDKWSSKCAAYIKLYKQFRDGTIDPFNYVPRNVWLSDPLYTQYDLTRFRTNISRMAKVAIGGNYSNYETN